MTAVETSTHVGRGSAIAHHGEILQGLFDCRSGYARALVTLPYPELRATATFTRPRDLDCLEVIPATKTKAHRACELTLQWLGEAEVGRLSIQSAIPLSRGLGSSTADVVASIRAVIAAFGHEKPRGEVEAKLAVQAEVASDALMFSHTPVLFAQREGTVIERLKQRLPALEVIGFDGNSRSRGIDTLSLPLPSYDADEVAVYRRLWNQLRRAVEDGSALSVAEIASQSALINQRHLPNPLFEFATSLAAEVGAAGFQVAHSGTVIGLLFDPRDQSCERRATAARTCLSRSGIKSWRFRVG